MKFLCTMEKGTGMSEALEQLGAKKVKKIFNVDRSMTATYGVKVVFGMLLTGK